MPEDSFNPYHEWLGLDRAVTRPNHYQLLGLPPTEQNVQRIAEAASRAMAKVRACRPGSRTTQWAQLLEEVTAAAACLTDPGRRAEYDRQLGSGAAAGRTYNRPAPRSRVAPAAGGATPALPMQAPQSVPTGYPQPAAGPAGYVDPMAPLLPAGPAAAPGYGQRPAYGVPQARPAPAVPAPGYPPAGQAPLAAARPVAAVPVGRPAAPVAAAPLAGRERSAATKIRSRAEHSNLTLLATCAGVGMLLLGILIVVIVLTRNPSSDGRSGPRPVVRSQPIAAPSRTRSETPPRPVRPAPQGATRPGAGGTGSASAAAPGELPSVPGGVPEAPPSSAGELSLPSFPAAPTVEQLASPAPSTPAAAPKPATPEASPEPAMPAQPAPAESAPAESAPGPSSPVGSPPSAPPAADSQPGEAAPMTPEPRESEPAKPESAAPPAAEPAAAEPAAKSSGVKPEDIAALAKTLKSARAAIREGQYDAALAELDQVESLPKRAEHHDKYNRLTLLAGYAKEFQSALQSSIAALQPAEQIEVGSNATVGFVGTAPGSITVRVTGTNRTYALDRLPVGLAVALVDRWLKKDDPVSSTIKGAYLASRKDLDESQQARARQWLEEGSKKGVEGELHKVLDDQYDLEKDVP